jgi:hypothetical protein
MRRLFACLFFWVVDPRRTLLWRLVLLAGLAFRVYAVLVIRNPMDALFSDPQRHWDNAHRFLTPNAMGASNPYLYQLYLYLVQKATQENKLAFGIVTAVLSVAYPLVWYLFARRVFRRKVGAMRFAALLCWLPTHISMFTFTMNETLILPLVGLALWQTHRTLDRRKPVGFVATAVSWTLALLTRSIVAPVGFVCTIVAWSRLRRWRGRLIGGALAFAFAAGSLGYVSVRAHAVINRYTPFGDNAYVSIYFVSGAHGYNQDFKGLGWYQFSSPSLYVSPFRPFYEFHSVREGTVKYDVDPKKRGADLDEEFRKELKENWRLLPRLVFENVIFLTFGHCWPPAGAGPDTFEQICLWERWIWLPLTLASFFGSIGYLVRRRRAAFVPMVALGFISTFYVAQAAVMEGRYRKPYEPVVLLTPLWLWDARRRRLPRWLRSRGKAAAPAPSPGQPEPVSSP